MEKSCCWIITRKIGKNTQRVPASTVREDILEAQDGINGSVFVPTSKDDAIKRWALNHNYTIEPYDPVKHHNE